MTNELTQTEIDFFKALTSSDDEGLDRETVEQIYNETLDELLLANGYIKVDGEYLWPSDGAGAATLSLAQDTALEFVRQAAHDFDIGYGYATEALAALDDIVPPHAVAAELMRVRGRGTRPPVAAPRRSKHRPDWMPWLPVQADEDSWNIFLEWFGPAPGAPEIPRVYLYVDGKQVEAPEVIASSGEKLRRVAFTAKCARPERFELGQTANGDVHVQLMTEAKKAEGNPRKRKFVTDLPGLS